MSRSSNTARKYVPEKAKQLQRIVEHMDRLRGHLDDLEEDITLDLIEGWSTGDPILDFALVTCNGAYDQFVISMQYRRLFDLGLRRPGQRILVVQKAEHSTDDGITELRNIYLATLRKAEVTCDINTLTLQIPVEPHYFVWQEFFQHDHLIGGYRTDPSPWLATGPLHNQYCDFGAARKDEQELRFVPEDAVCDIELLPDVDKSYLYEVHGIDEHLLNRLHQYWIRHRSSPPAAVR